MPPTDSPYENGALPVGSYRPRGGIIATRAEGAMVLLDRARGRYLTLNHVASDIWEQLAAGATVIEIVDQVCAEYSAPREQVEADVRMQVHDLLRCGLIESASGVATRSREAESDAKGAAAAVVPAKEGSASWSPGPGLPSYLRCVLVISAIKLRLMVQGYGSTIDWIRRRVERVPATNGASLNDVGALEFRMATAAAFYPGRALCLERSLALYYILRRQGVAASYCQGVQPYPFQAHAWVEYRGQVLNDIPEHAKQFTPLPDQLP